MWFILFLVSLLLGYLTISFWRQDFSKLEKLFISFSLGMGEISLLMFLMGLLNISLTAGNVLVYTLVLCIFLTIIGFIKSGNLFKIQRSSFPKLTIFEIPLLLIILFLIFWSLTQTINWPPWEWDVLALYDFRGKVMVQTHSLATEFFTSQPNLTAYNYVYPFSTSLMHTLIYIGGGSNPQFIYSLYYASLIFLLYACLRRRVSRLQSLTLAAVLASTAEILFPSTIAYPNIPYALYFGFSTIYFWEWTIHRKVGYFIVSALFLALSAWLRSSEPFWIVNVLFILVLLLREKRFALIAVFLAFFLPLNQLWSVYQKYIFSHAENVFFSPPQPFGFDLTKVPEVLFFVLKFFVKDWLGYLFLLLVVVLFLGQKTRKYKYILFWLASYLIVAVLGTYFFSVSFPWWNQIGGSAARISVFFAPLILYAISVFWFDSAKGLGSYFKNASFFLKVDRKKYKLIKWP